MAQINLFYARIRPELADEFLQDAELTFTSMRERPQSFPRMHRDVRRARCKQFPYKVYFRIRAEEVRVLAIYHVSRDPRRWQDRG